jgi:glycine betaine/proline transport system ATP-binding protein
MQDELLRLQRTLNKTILFITHDFQEALKLGTRIAIMSEGKLVREGTPQSIVLDPGSDYVAAFTRDVDRSRLFNAGFSMTSLVPLVRRSQFVVLGCENDTAGSAFVIDSEQRVLGVLPATNVGAVRDGGPLPALSSAFACVSTQTRLIDVAAQFTRAETVGVTDEMGRLVGRLEAGQILARIGGNVANGASYV